VGELLAYLADASEPPTRNLLEPTFFDEETQRLLRTTNRRISMLEEGFEQMHRRDHTIGMLRWIIRHGRRILDDAETARRYERYRRVRLLAESGEAYVAAGATVFNKHRPVTRCVWITPYLVSAGRAVYAVQGFRAPAAGSMDLAIRVNSYALRPHKGTLVVTLPEGWPLARDSATGWTVETGKDQRSRAVRSITTTPMDHESYALTLPVPSNAKPGPYRLSFGLHAPGLAIAPTEVRVEVRPTKR
jgi:hypothetical protein